jgi:hypothetical protein
MNKINNLILIVVLLLSSCQMLSNRRGDERIARVHNKFLYRSDLDGLVPIGTNAADSSAIVQRFIDQWVKNKLLLHEAENKVSKEMVNFQRKVDDYRNSLMIFSFESQLISENLDTLITDDLMLEYYERHKNEFKLRHNIVKVNFVKVPIDAPDINLVRRLIRSEQPDDLVLLEEYCINHAAGYFLDPDSWFLFSDIMREVPVNAADHENYLRSNRYVEISDSFFQYFLFIRDYQLEGTTSPFAYQADNIKAIILNHRKQNLINQYRHDLYMNAVKESKFEVF